MKLTFKTSGKNRFGRIKKIIYLMFVLDLVLVGCLFICSQNRIVIAVLSNETEVNRTPEKNELKKIALTFDDGPHPYYTEQLLDGLKERGVVATFFVTGEHATLHPDIIERMSE